MSVHRLAGAGAIDPAALAAATGPIRSVACARLATVGYTAARHECVDLTLQTGERRRLVVKRFRLSTDWTARRTGDRRGREAALLAEPALEAVWEAFACPYLAFAADGDRILLVMDDLSPCLLPDVREPLREEQEARLLAALAALHARFWEAPALALPWLARPAHYAGLIDARCAAAAAACALLPPVLREGVTHGWAAALARLPRAAAQLMTAPAAELGWLWDGLPRTLLHGDVKVANFALLPDGRVAAFDWAMLGAGPVGIDLGWYLAVNATRLAGTKEAMLARYRALLARRLAARPAPAAADVLLDARWDAMVRAGVVAGARMLLWAKALAVESDRPGARAEWAWWTEHLEAARG